MFQMVETGQSTSPIRQMGECVDPATWHLVERLFPEPARGQAFFTRFLERAAHACTIIPGTPDRCVGICTQSIAALGQVLGLSNDTTQKYVKLYCALGLLTRQKYLDQQAFLLHVGQYQVPQTLETNLDRLIEQSRPRLRAMATDVKARCKLYGLISLDLVAALSQLNALLQTTKGTSRCVLERSMHQAQALTSTLLTELGTGRLQGEGLQKTPTTPCGCRLPLCTHQEDSLCDEPGQDSSLLRLQQMYHPEMLCADRREETPQAAYAERFVSAMVLPNRTGPPEQKERRGNGGLARETPPVSERLDELDARRASQESTRSGGNRQERQSNTFLPSMQTDRHASTRKVSNLLVSAQQRSDDPERQEQNPPRLAPPGRFDSETSVPNLSQAIRWGDGSQERQQQESPPSAHSGRFAEASVTRNHPQSARQEDSCDVTHVNVITFIRNTITFNVRSVALFCCQVFDEAPSKQGIYCKLFKHINYDVQAITTALIYTLVHQRDGTIRNLPSVFLTRCKDFHQPVPPDPMIFAEAQNLMQKYGHLAYPQFLEAMCCSDAFSSPVPTTAFSSMSKQTTPTPSILVSVSPSSMLASSIPVDHARMVMSMQEANQLIQSIRQDHQTGLFRCCRVPYGDESPRSAVLIDASNPGGQVHQTIVYSVQEWQERLASMRTWRDLFAPVPASCMLTIRKER